MADKSSPKDLEEWLKDKPKEWAQVLANRCALRVVPVLGSAIMHSNLSEVILNNMTLATMRASLVLEVFAVSSAPEIKGFANNAAIAADVVGSTIAPDSPLLVAGIALDRGTAHAAGAAVIASARAIDAPHLASYAVLKTLSAYVAPHGKNSADAAGLAAVAASAADAALENDVRLLLNYEGYGYSPPNLLSTTLWQGTRNPLLLEWQSLKQSLLNFDLNWQFWIDWYQSKLDGTLYPGLTQVQQDELYYQIATFPNELWEEGAKAVNQQIVKLMEELKIYESTIQPPKTYDFFLSYSTTDETLAKKVTEIIEQEDYSVFVQFKDMPVGSNFITEMQEGLEKSSRFICLYSEAYKQSSACQAEWGAAFNEDRDGKKRNIISFLIENVSPPPLAKQIVHKNIIGMSTEEVRRAVLEAIKPALLQTKIEARAYAKEAVSPVPYTNSEGKLDVQANKEFDQQILTEQLEKLPKRQIKLVEYLLAELEERNIVPKRLCIALESYKEEFKENGVQPDIELLNDQIDLIKLDLAGTDANHWVNELVTEAMGKLLSNHIKVQTHFPLDIERQTKYQDSPVDPEKLADKYFSEKMHRLETFTKQFKEEHLATKEFLKFKKNQNEEIQQLLNIDASLFRPSAEDSPTKPKLEVDIEESKKRRLSKVSGFLDRLSDTLSKSDKFAKSPTAQKMLETAKELSDWLWS